MRVTTSILQNNFGRYLKFAKDGMDITVTKNGYDIAKLIGIEEPYIIAESNSEYKLDEKMTYKEFKNFNQEGKRYELIDGYVFNMSSPNAEHQNIVLELGIKLKSFFYDKSCTPFISPFDVILNRGRGESNLVQPDLLVICDKENIDENKRYLGTPKLVMEVLSPNNRSHDMVLKLDLYKDSGVKEYWIVSPVEKVVFVYHFDKCEIKEFKVFSKDDAIRSFEFHELRINVRDLFLGIY